MLVRLLICQKIPLSELEAVSAFNLRAAAVCTNLHLEVGEILEPDCKLIICSYSVIIYRVIDISGYVAFLEK